MSTTDPEQLSLGLSPEEDQQQRRPAPDPTTSGEVEAAVDLAEPLDPFPPTGEQAAAIDARDRDVFLEAGAGTGKTRVLVDRYCDAIDIDGVEPERILAFTFTEKAAAEMRRRARIELSRRATVATDPERRTRLERAARTGEAAPITTIHGYCRRLLATYPVAAGLDPRFRVLDATEAARLQSAAFERALELGASEDERIAIAAAGYGGRLAGMVVAAYDDLRNQGARTPSLPPMQMSAFTRSSGEVDPEEAELGAASYGAVRRLLELFMVELDQLKTSRSGVDFDDLQLIALELLETNSAIGTSQAERYDHLLVDEFQDTSPIQVRLVQALCAAEGRLFAVGDEFQSIYAFRGADLESFRSERELMRARPDGLVLPLSGSFRSRPDVVAAVNAIGRTLLDDFNELRVGIAPSSEQGEGTVELLLVEANGWNEDDLRFNTASPEAPNSRLAEARTLAQRLRTLADEGVDPAGMVVLLRAFTGVEVYAEALELAGLDPYVVGGRGYWSLQQVSDALALLACVANPLDDQQLLSALASPACGASADALWILRQAAGRGRHLWPTIADRLTAAGREALERRRQLEEAAGEDPEGEAEGERAKDWIGRLPPADAARLERFAERLVALRHEAGQLPLETLVETTLERFDYDLAALSMDDGRRRSANLAKLIGIAAEYETHEGRDLRGFLSHAGDRAALSDREAEAAVAAEHHAGVKVMTIHAAKGLEFDCVAVPELGRGMSAGTRPLELQLAFGRGADSDDEVEAGVAPSAPRIGLRLARAGAGSVDLAGFRDLTDEAAAAEAEESGRLTYVAASRARERLILSGRFKPIDIDGGPAESKPSHSVLSRLLPAFGVTGVDGAPIELPAPSARAELAKSFAPTRVPISIIAPSPETVAALNRDLRSSATGPAADPAKVRPPMLDASERGGSAARSLSYAALAAYERCGYRFMVERVIGLSENQESGVGSGDERVAPDPEVGWGGSAETSGAEGVSAGASSRFGLGRAVHELLEASAHRDWEDPSDEQIGAALQLHGVAADRITRARQLTDGWLKAPLLAELRQTGARMRPEVSFRIRLGRETIIRGTIDLLVEIPGRAPLVVDYKTDAQAPSSGEPLADAYLLQRSLYALAISQTTGAAEVESVYAFLVAPQMPVRDLLSSEEIEAGRDHLERLCGEIDERHFEVTDQPHAALCHDCPARARLCPHPPEMTLRADPTVAPSDVGTHPPR